MEYLLLKRSLRFTQFEQQLDLKNKHSISEPIAAVKDNYAQHGGYGLYTNDDINALNHAYQMIERINSSKNASERQILEWKATLCADFKNYLTSSNYLCTRPEKNCRVLIEALASYRCIDELVDTLEDYYNSFKSDYDSQSYSFPDYIDLYEKIGDHYLFLKQDCATAMHFYRLANLDWYHILDDDSYNDREIDQDKIERLNEWRNKYQHYEQILSFSLPNGSLVSSDAHVNECNAEYYEIVKLYSSNASNEECLSRANMYMSALDRLIESSGDNFSILRECILMAHSIRQNLLFIIIDHLADETKSNQNNLAKDAIEAIKSYDAITMREIKTYVISKPDGKPESIFQNVILLVKSCGIIDCIRNELRVKLPTQTMAYYTSINTLRYMLPEKALCEEDVGKLSIMNIAYMNDPTEGLIIKEYIFSDDVSENESNRSVASYPYVFMKCFTSRIDDLPMWEMYGNHAEGCCILIEWPKSSTNDDDYTMRLYRVCYVKKKNHMILKEDNSKSIDTKKVSQWLSDLHLIAKEIVRDPEAKRAFGLFIERIAYLFKSSDYQYENEMRIVYTYPHRDDVFKHTNEDYPKLYIQTNQSINIKEIILGPKFNDIAGKMPYLQEQIERMCETTGRPIPRLSLSSIDYK